MRIVFTAILTVITFNTLHCQKAKMVQAEGLNLKGSHESLNSFNSYGFTITRADSSFQNSTVLSLGYDWGALRSSYKILGSEDYYDAGFALLVSVKKGFFTSKRPTNNPNSPDQWNLFLAEFDTLSPLRGIKAINELNTPKSECCLVINDSGNAYFSSNREGSWDIYQADYAVQEQKFINIQKVESLSTDEDEWPSYIHPDNDLIIFSSIRKSGIGGDDLYFSVKENEIWQASQLFSKAINTKTYEDSGLLSPDFKHLYFSSRRADNQGNTDSNIYHIKASRTKLRKYLRRTKK